ncbi:MAG: tetratricopeptide repeat protein [Chloroflexia bacterium]
MAGNKAIFDTAMKRAHEYAWANQWERAMKEYGRALSEFPDDMTARRNMAQCLFRLRRWAQAMEAYEALVQADPSDLFGVNRLAEIHLAIGNTDEAKATYMRLTDLYTGKNQFHEAIRAVRDLARALPKDKEVRIRLLDLTQEAGDKQAQAAEHLALSQISQEEGNLAEAQGYAEAASALDPESNEIRRWAYSLKRKIAENAGTITLDSNEYGGRKAAAPGTGLIRAQEDPPEAVALVEKATEAQNQGDFRAALEFYDGAVRAGAKRGAVFYSAGLLHQQMGRPDLAIPMLERSLHDSEFTMSANYVLGQCYSTQRAHAKAATAFERALGMIDFEQITMREADELIELYMATADAHLADNNPGRASSLYNNLATLFKARKFNHPQTPELEKRAQDLYNQSIQSKLMGISKGGSNWLDPGRLPDVTEMAPVGEDATRMDMGDMPLNAEGGTSIIEEGTQELQAAVRDDKPTSLMRTAGGALRSITEYLRAASIPGAGNSSDNLETSGPIQTAQIEEPGTQAALGEGQAPMPGTVALPADEEEKNRRKAAPGTHFLVRSPLSTEFVNTGDMATGGARALDAQRLIAEGEQAMGDGRWDVAIDSCMAVLSADPGYLPVHIMLGDIYLQMGHVEEAITKYTAVMDTYVARAEPENAAEVCRRLLQLDPGNPMLQNRLGVLLLEAGKVDEAAKALLGVAERHYGNGEVERALEEAEALKAQMPNSSEVALAMGTYLGVLGRQGEALLELSRALHLDPGNDLALGRLYVTLAQGNEVTAWDALQSILERAGKRKSANRLFLEELNMALKPEGKRNAHPAIYYGLAVLAGRTDLMEIAADALDQGIVIMTTAETREMDNSWLLLEVLMRQYRGDLALMAKSTGKDLGGGAVAAQHYNRVLEILKTHGGLDDVSQKSGDLTIQSPRPQYGFTQVSEPIQLYYSLAEANASQNNWDGAMGALQALKQIMPNDYSVYTRLADIYFRQGQLNQALAELNDLLVLFQKNNDNEKTLETLGHMAKLAPNNVAVRRKLSDMYLKLGMTEYGLRELNTLAELQLKAGLLKDAIRTYRKAADLHYTMGQHDHAIGTYERIVRIAPRDVDARQHLLNMYVQSGRLKEAVEGERGLAELFIHDGRTEEAIAALHQLLALAPQDVPGHYSLAKQLTALGEYGQAARLYGRLIKLDPDNDRLEVMKSEMERMDREKEVGNKGDVVGAPRQPETQKAGAGVSGGRGARSKK